MEKVQQQKLFQTADLWIASYLEYRGIPSLLENRNRRVVFLFPASETLYRLLTAFQTGDPVPLSEYIEIYKALKNKMFNARGGA